MKKVIILLFITSMARPGFTQISLDSALAIWNNESLADTVRLKAIDGSLRQMTQGLTPAESYPLLEAFIELAKKNDNAMLEANGYMTYGQIVSHFDDNLALARSNFEKALKIYKTLEFTHGIGRAMSNIGGTYRTEDPVKTISMTKDAIELCLAAGEMRAAIGTSYNLSSLYLQFGDNVKAFDAITRGVKWAEELDDKEFMLMAYHGLAHVYNALLDLEKANEFHDKTLNLTRTIGDKATELAMLLHIAKAYENQGNFSKALQYAKKGQILAEKTNHPYYLVGSSYGLAQLYIKSDSLELANAYIEIADAFRDESITNGYDHSFDLLFGAKHIHGELKLKKGLYTEASNLCDEARKLAIDNGRVSYEKQACECLFDAYKNLKMGNEALEIQDRLQEIEAMAQNEEVALKLQQMEFSKALLADSIAQAEKDRLVENAHNEEVRKKNRNQYFLIGAGLLVLLLAGGIYSRLRYVRKSKAIIESERDRSDNLLLNILPADIAKELKEKGKADARDFDMVSILFTDFKEFTQAAEKLTAAELVNEINACFEAFDSIMAKYKIEKIKTIGDAYMAAGGLPIPTDDSAKNTVLAALEMQAFITKRQVENKAENKPAFEMRLGIHTGPVVAGIVGVKKFQYDIWGDTVNTASRMESHGEVGKVNISKSTYILLKDESEFTFENRGKVEAKGKGEMEMWFVSKK